MLYMRYALEITVLLFTALNCICAGSYITMSLRFKEYRDKLDVYEKVAKAASESNESIAKRVLEIGDKVNNVQQFLNATNTQTRKF